MSEATREELKAEARRIEVEIWELNKKLREIRQSTEMLPRVNFAIEGEVIYYIDFTKEVEKASKDDLINPYYLFMEQQGGGSRGGIVTPFSLIGKLAVRRFNILRKTGTSEFVEWMDDLIAACVKFPNAEIYLDGWRDR